MKPAPFDYVQAESVEHALTLLAEHGDESKILAGGQSLIPMLNLRLARPCVLVDIGGLHELRGADELGQGLQCGSLLTHHELALGRHPALRGYRALADAAALIGHYPIRTRGTLGGSVAHADNASEWCLMALVLDAVIIAAGPGGMREIPAAEFFLGFFTTALRPDELIIGIRFPRPAAATRLEEFARRSGDFAIVAAAADLIVESGACRQARVALGGVAASAVRVPAAEAVLEGLRLDDARGWQAAIREAAHICSARTDPPSDIHGSAAYRRRLTVVLTERALRRCLAEAVLTGTTTAARAAPAASRKESP